jgi:hypothetical protein
VVGAAERGVQQAAAWRGSSHSSVQCWCRRCCHRAGWELGPGRGAAQPSARQRDGSGCVRAGRRGGAQCRADSGAVAAGGARGSSRAARAWHARKQHQHQQQHGRDAHAAARTTAAATAAASASSGGRRWLQPPARH